MKEAYCPRCGKYHIATPQHIYRDEKGLYCSWTCYLHKDDRKKKSSKNNKNKSVELLSQSGTLLKEFSSATDAAKETGFDCKCIQLACRDQSVYRGYLWRYKNDLP